MKRSKFNLSHRLLTTGDFGYLYPILCEDLLPGDKVKLSSEVYMRAIPLLSPPLDSADIRVDYFFVPNRIIWEDWQKFITGGRLGTSELIEPWIAYEPNPVSGQDYTSDLFSYLYQLPNKVQFGQGGIKLSALPLAAYQRIYFDWYLDQNVENDYWRDNDIFGDEEFFRGFIDSRFVQSDGSLAQLDFFSDWSQLRQRKYKKDMFTSALPWPQRGPEIGISFPADDVNLEVSGIAEQTNSYKTGNIVQSQGSLLSPLLRQNSANNSNFNVTGSGGETGYYHSHSLDASVDLLSGQAGNLTIRELRRLSAIQKWFERNARWGSRYIEQILSHFGVHTPDYRLSRSEYLGGTYQPINISETYQTAQGAVGQETADVLGQYAGHMSSYGVSKMRKFKASEHGWLIGLLSVVPRPSYGQGIQRRFTRQTRLDYAWPEFAAIGEQAILNKELYISETDSDFLPSSAQNQLNSVFGYTPRYAEYKSRQDRFNTNFLHDFNWWHLGRIFNNRPVLNQEFLEAVDSTTGDSEFDRIFAYNPTEEQDVDKFHFLFSINHHLIMRRPLPKYVNPSLS